MEANVRIADSDVLLSPTKCPSVSEIDVLNTESSGPSVSETSEGKRSIPYGLLPLICPGTVHLERGYMTADRVLLEELDHR